jgi:hypothetical protein
LLLIGVVCGRAVVETQAVEVAAGPLLLGLAGGLAVLAVIVAGPVPCIAGVVALTIYSPVPRLAVGGGIDVTVMDAFYAGLAGWWVLHAAGLRRRDDVASARSPVRSAPVLIFLAYIGLTLLYVASVDPGSLSTSSISWLRLLQTASLGWLAATFLRTRRDVALVLGVVAATAALAVVLAVVGAVGTEGSGPLGNRGGDVINANELGLVSGLLLLLAFFPAVTPRLVYRLAFAAFGCLGLVQSASAASIFGTAVALVLGLTLAARTRQDVVGMRAAKVVAALVLGVTLAYTLTSAIRPENLPTSKQFYRDSAGQRVILGAAGIEIASNHPIIGVGWQRSSDPAVVGDPNVTTQLRADFPQTREDFFPDVTPMQVHNAYVQVPAELGLIGAAIFVSMIWSLGRGVRQVVRRARRGTVERHQLWFLGSALVLVLVWMNDNPMFGAQTETVIPALFVGAIAALGSTIIPGAERQRPELAPTSSSR